MTLLADAFNLFNVRDPLEYNAAVESVFGAANPGFGTVTSENVAGQHHHRPFHLRLGPGSSSERDHGGGGCRSMRPPPPATTSTGGILGTVDVIVGSSAGAIVRLHVDHRHLLYRAAGVSGHVHRGPPHDVLTTVEGSPQGPAGHAGDEIGVAPDGV